MQITVTKKTEVTRTITGCIHQCPYFETEGMEHLMVCTHPDTPQTSYDNAIISWDNGYEKFPPKCPLLKAKE